MKATSHFRFNRSQRNGMFFLVVIILTVRLFSFFTDRSYESRFWSLLEAENGLDSLNDLKQERAYEVYRFNPNYIDDFKGYSLGMALAELDRLYEYRKKGMYVNSVKEFKEVTELSDSLLKIISPYFRFPELKRVSPQITHQHLNGEESGVEGKLDINKAESRELMKIKGVGKVFSNRILKYRGLLGGYIEMNQLYEVYGLDSLVVRRIFRKFKVDDLSAIRKMNVNEASVKQLTSHVYIDKDFATAIVMYRTKKGEIKDLAELTKIQGFPSDKINLIQVYLTVD